ncbi:MAG: hypothetical protein OXE46_15220 [Chloroflexi bacterium]|nr:hypothetical protein [Chloroflexota bacterium]
MFRAKPLLKMVLRILACSIALSALSFVWAQLHFFGGIQLTSADELVEITLMIAYSGGMAGLILAIPMAFLAALFVAPGRRSLAVDRFSLIAVCLIVYLLVYGEDLRSALSAWQDFPVAVAVTIGHFILLGGAATFSADRYLREVALVLDSRKPKELP